MSNEDERAYQIHFRESSDSYDSASSSSDENDDLRPSPIHYSPERIIKVAAKSNDHLAGTDSDGPSVAFKGYQISKVCSKKKIAPLQVSKPINDTLVKTNVNSLYPQSDAQPILINSLFPQSYRTCSQMLSNARTNSYVNHTSEFLFPNNDETSNFSQVDDSLLQAKDFGIRSCYFGKIGYCLERAQTNASVITISNVPRFQRAISFLNKKYMNEIISNNIIGKNKLTSTKNGQVFPLKDFCVANESQVGSLKNFPYLAPPVVSREVNSTLTKTWAHIVQNTPNSKSPKPLVSKSKNQVTSSVPNVRIVIPTSTANKTETTQRKSKSEKPSRKNKSASNFADINSSNGKKKKKTSKGNSISKTLNVKQPNIVTSKTVSCPKRSLDTKNKSKALVENSISTTMKAPQDLKPLPKKSKPSKEVIVNCSLDTKNKSKESAMKVPQDLKPKAKIKKPSKEVILTWSQKFIKNETNILTSQPKGSPAQISSEVFSCENIGDTTKSISDILPKDSSEREIKSNMNITLKNKVVMEGTFLNTSENFNLNTTETSENPEVPGEYLSVDPNKDCEANDYKIERLTQPQMKDKIQYFVRKSPNISDMNKCQIPIENEHISTNVIDEVEIITQNYSVLEQKLSNLSKDLLNSIEENEFLIETEPFCKTADFEPEAQIVTNSMESFNSNNCIPKVVVKKRTRNRKRKKGINTQQALEHLKSNSISNTKSTDCYKAIEENFTYSQLEDNQVTQDIPFVHEEISIYETENILLDENIYVDEIDTYSNISTPHKHNKLVRFGSIGNVLTEENSRVVNMKVENEAIEEKKGKVHSENLIDKMDETGCQQIWNHESATIDEGDIKNILTEAESNNFETQVPISLNNTVKVNTNIKEQRVEHFTDDAVTNHDSLVNCESKNKPKKKKRAKSVGDTKNDVKMFGSLQYDLNKIKFESSDNILTEESSDILNMLIENKTEEGEYSENFNYKLDRTRCWPTLNYNRSDEELTIESKNLTVGFKQIKHASEIQPYGENDSINLGSTKIILTEENSNNFETEVPVALNDTTEENTNNKETERLKHFTDELNKIGYQQIMTDNVMNQDSVEKPAGKKRKTKKKKRAKSVSEIKNEIEICGTSPHHLSQIIRIGSIDNISTEENIIVNTEVDNETIEEKEDSEHLIDKVEQSVCQQKLNNNISDQEPAIESKNMTEEFKTIKCAINIQSYNENDIINIGSTTNILTEEKGNKFETEVSVVLSNTPNNEEREGLEFFTDKVCRIGSPQILSNAVINKDSLEALGSKRENSKKKKSEKSASDNKIDSEICGTSKKYSSVKLKEIVGKFNKASFTRSSFESSCFPEGRENECKLGSNIEENLPNKTASKIENQFCSQQVSVSDVDKKLDISNLNELPSQITSELESKSSSAMTTEKGIRLLKGDKLIKYNEKSSNPCTSDSLPNKLDISTDSSLFSANCEYEECTSHKKEIEADESLNFNDSLKPVELHINHKDILKQSEYGQSLEEFSSSKDPYSNNYYTSKFDNNSLSNITPISESEQSKSFDVGKKLIQSERVYLECCDIINENHVKSIENVIIKNPRDFLEISEDIQSLEPPYMENVTHKTSNDFLGEFDLSTNLKDSFERFSGTTDITNIKQYKTSEQEKKINVENSLNICNPKQSGAEENRILPNSSVYSSLHRSEGSSFPYMYEKGDMDTLYSQFNCTSVNSLLEQNDNRITLMDDPFDQNLCVDYCSDDIEETPPGRQSLASKCVIA